MNNPLTLLSSNPDELQADIARAVVNALTPMLTRPAETTAVSAERLAEMMSLHVSTIQRHTRAGKIPYLEIGGVKRYDPAAVFRALSSDGAEP